jgi:hypothetical protein
LARAVSDDRMLRVVVPACRSSRTSPTSRASLTHRLPRLAALACLVMLPVRTIAQAPRAFSIFLDCSGFYCEPDFYRTDIAFVDHVRERTAADVHVLITREGTGGGGNAFVLAFYGQHRFAGVSDTLTASTAQGATEDERRQVLSRTIKLGLARYLARTADAARTTVAVGPAAATDSATPSTRDPWNAWVFRLSMNVNANRERDFSSDNIYSSLSATQVTEAFKSSFRLNESYNGQSFTIEDDKITSIRRNFSGSTEQVKSLTPHLSAGFRASAGSSSFLNQHLFASAGPAAEYNIYPYKESTRHMLTFLYTVGLKHFRYEDTTVYFKTRETRPFESLAMNLSQKQKWGSLSMEVSAQHYLDDMRKNHLTFQPEADVRLFKGLSLNMFGYYTLLHDQIYLPKGDLTREQVLLRQGQVATTYTAFMYLGISYTFGSVLNNVVNPRFGSSSEF